MGQQQQQQQLNAYEKQIRAGAKFRYILVLRQLGLIGGDCYYHLWNHWVLSVK